MSHRARGHRPELSGLAQQALREIVRDCLRTNGLGLCMPEEQAVSAAIELIETGFVRLEYDPTNGAYWLEVAE